MASKFCDIMHPTIDQFVYLKCPVKIGQALWRAGGPRLSVDQVERKLVTRGRPRPVNDVGEPDDSDAVIWQPRGLAAKFLRKPPAPVKPRKPKLVITAEERARIAAIAATIPDRVEEKPHRVMRKKLDPTAANFPDQLIRYVLRQAGLNRASFFKKRRRGKEKAAAALVAVVLRDLDARKYSYPKLARILRKKDHTTIVHAVARWPFYAEEWPDLDVIHAAICDELQGGGE